jgi:hypothetical protein
MPAGTTIADYLDAIRYRRYTQTEIQNRQRYLAHALLCGDDAWLMEAPVDEVLARVQAHSQIRSKLTLQRASTALEDYRAWRRRREGSDA